MTEQEQIDEMANISTKEEIEARNKRDKEKDELRQALLHYATAEASGGIKTLIDCEGCAFYLYEMLGYRKVTEDSIVLSKEEYEKLLESNKNLKYSFDTASSYIEKLAESCEKNCKKFNGITTQQASKETAEKLYDKINENICVFQLENKNQEFTDGYAQAIADICGRLDQVAKQFGVEIKE